MKATDQTKIDHETLKVLIATIFHTLDITRDFVWNETQIKYAFAVLIQESKALQPFSLSLFHDGMQHVLIRWFRDECVNVVDAHRSRVRLNDTCLYFIRERRALLSDEVLAAIDTIAAEFYWRTQTPS